MSKLSIILCAVFLVSVIAAKDADVVNKCVDSIEKASELVWGVYAELPEPKNDEQRQELYKLTRNGDETLNKISDKVSNAETMEVQPVALPKDIGQLTIQCSKEVGDSVVQVVTGTIVAMKNYNE